MHGSLRVKYKVICTCWTSAAVLRNSSMYLLPRICLCFFRAFWAYSSQAKRTNASPVGRPSGYFTNRSPSVPSVTGLSEPRKPRASWGLAVNGSPRIRIITWFSFERNWATSLDVPVKRWGILHLKMVSCNNVRKTAVKVFSRHIHWNDISAGRCSFTPAVCEAFQRLLTHLPPWGNGSLSLWPGQSWGQEGRGIEFPPLPALHESARERDSQRVFHFQRGGEWRTDTHTHTHTHLAIADGDLHYK